MGEKIVLRAEDGHEFDAYVARPAGEPIAGLVVVQEIFGVNDHIRRVTDEWARDGFLAVAPAMFDRIERGLDVGYEGEDLIHARTFGPRVDAEKALLDLNAAIAFARASKIKVGIVGYCFGGSMAYMAAARLKVDAAVGYYGGKILSQPELVPQCPTMLHFGRLDTHIPVEGVEKLAATHPEIPVYLYDAGHGFSCDARAAYHPESARVARERSLEFLKKHLTE